MNTAQADVLAAREHLRQRGWIARRSESFHHLPPPELGQWLGADAPGDCATPPLAGAGWTLLPLQGASAGGVDARWLDARDAQQRAQLLAGLPGPGEGEAAPFAWAHRALCRRGLRVRVAARPGHEGDVVCLALRHQPHSPVEAPLLVLELDPGVRVLLLETHERAAGGCPHAITQNLHAHIHLGSGAQLEHLRIALPGAADQLAQHVHARLAGGAHYAQVLVAGAAAYHLQRSTVELEGAGASAHSAALLLTADGAQLDHQVVSRLQARHTRSQVESLALAQGRSRVVSNAHTRIAPGADEASVRQRLSGVPLWGQPRLILRPHLEILHDNVHAAHGATWGALPEDALFYASQRGLSEAHARALIVEGMARALLERGLPGSPLLAQWLDSGALAAAMQRLREQAQGDAP